MRRGHGSGPSGSASPRTGRKDHARQPAPLPSAPSDALTIPVAGGEQEYSDWRFRGMIADRGVNIVQPDLHYYGGMIRLPAGAGVGIKDVSDVLKGAVEV